MPTSVFLGGAGADQSLNTTDSPTFAGVSVGTAPLASDGTVRLRSGFVIKARHSTNEFDVPILSGVDDIVRLGDVTGAFVSVSGGIASVAGGPGGEAALYGNDGATSVVASTSVTITGPVALVPVAFASLPASPSEGMVAWVNDSNTATWGATVAGGGANKVLVVFNSANWTVAGK